MSQGALGFFAGYSLNWISPGGSSSFLFTSDPIAPGFNVFTSIALSRHTVNEPGAFAVAGIYRWEAYDENGVARSHEVGTDWVTQNSAFINNCRTVTYAIVVEGGLATAQISLATL